MCSVFTIAAIVAIVFIVNRPKNATTPITAEVVQKTDLTSVSSDKIQDYINLLNTPITDMPWYIPKDTKSALENQLGITLRAKYGANTLKATVRGDTKNLNGVQVLLIDVAEKNESYYGQYSTDQTANVSIGCANQPDQINPDTSKCVTLPAEDNYKYIFVKG